MTNAGPLARHASPLLLQAEAAADAVDIPAERLIVLDGAPSSQTGGHPNLRERPRGGRPPR